MIEVVELTVKAGGAEVRAGARLVATLEEGTTFDSLKEKEGHHLIAIRGKKGWVDAESVDAETVIRVTKVEVTPKPADTSSDSARSAFDDLSKALEEMAEESTDVTVESPNKRLTAVFTQDGRVVVTNHRTLTKWAIPERGPAYKSPLGTFSADSSAVLFATADKMLYCVRTVDGKRLWTTRLDCGEIGVPNLAVEGNKMSLLAGGVMYEFDVKTGKQLSRQMEPEVAPDDAMQADPS